ncbi:MBL fold metallo-hydrolase [Nocardioides mangrovi]|uniref:MBL fold metallo-hydrolase n=1 Tax=Nocardioides mangrovi TaxID=2874580 RepID=A0ABS7UEB9_9ACTN|nr:MBL fold metallo-hydrolase [Nocardioides mangrovi]MBZ5739200.1 MBL fold metallo-hydrolase [Nocardioides mangrovi]
MTDLALTWWGHAAATVTVGGTRVALDPLLGDHLFHLHRYTAPPPAEAADADVVLVSHLHHDHLHLPSLQLFGADVPILVPRGGESLLRGLGADRVVPVAPGEVHDVAGARITVLAATHDGSRGPQSRAEGPPLGFRIDAAGRSCWFPGDTELREDMYAVGAVDLALVPIGGWGPTLDDGHMDPVDGAEAVRRVGAEVAVPVHWGTFWPRGLRRLAKANHDRLFVTPGERFLAAMEDVPAQALLIAPGESVEL